MAKTSVKEFKLVDVDLLVPYANNARTQMELADILHVSFTTISRWESGKFEPTMKIKRKIIEYCAKNNINVEDVK